MKASDWISVKDRLPRTPDYVLYAESVVVKGGLHWRLMFGLRNTHIGTTNKALIFTMSPTGRRLFYLKKKSYEKYRPIPQ